MESSITAVRIPAFNFKDPALWFSMCDSTFELGTPKPVTDSRTKYNYVVAHLPPEAASTVRNIILHPDATDPYGVLRNQLIKSFSESSWTQLRKLLSCEPMGDRIPSEILRELRRRVEGNNVPNELLMELFMQYLPSNVQQILTAVDNLTLDKAAELSDKLFEINTAQVQVHSASQQALTSGVRESRDAGVREFKEEITDIQKRLTALEKSVKALCKSRSRSRSTSVREYTCWYHRKFADKATKCVSPCHFKKNGESEE